MSNLTARLKREAKIMQVRSGMKGKLAFGLILKKLKNAYYSMSEQEKKECVKEWEQGRVMSEKTAKEEK